MQTENPRILVVDDLEMNRSMLRMGLERDGFHVDEAEDAAIALTMIGEFAYDMVLLDIMMPGMSGKEALMHIRHRKDSNELPVIMVTAYDDSREISSTIAAGANDYVTKPFKFPVLLARIRAQLRQHEQSEDAVFQLGPYTFKPSMKMLITEEDRKIRLTEKETNILKFLYRSTDGVVARDVLLHEVWGYNAGVTTHTLETHIYRLRQKIEPDPSNARLLVTESGGYRLVS